MAPTNLITVKYANGQTGKVNFWDLDILIESGRITAFQRQSGWAEIGASKLRKNKGSIRSSERRTHHDDFFNKPINEKLAKKVIDLEEENRSLKYDLKNLQQIIADSDDAIILQNSEGTIISWNRGAEKMYGYSKSEAVGMNILNIVPRKKHSEVINVMKQLEAGEVVHSFETTRLTKDEKELTIRVTSRTLHDNSGNAIIATTERNITEKDNKAQENKQLKNELQKALATIKTVQDIIPACTSCKYIRYNHGGYRGNLELY